MNKTTSEKKNGLVDFTNILQLNKVNISKLKEFKDKNDILFQHPETFLSLPNENSFKFVVGKKIEGPRYNEEGNIISYSIVGDNKNIIKKLEKQNNGNNSQKNSVIGKGNNQPIKQQATSPKIIITNNMSNQIVTNNDLKTMFNNYRTLEIENYKKKSMPKKIFSRKFYLKNNIRKYVDINKIFVDKKENIENENKIKKKKKEISYSIKECLQSSLNLQEKSLKERDKYLIDNQKLKQHIKYRLNSLPTHKIFNLMNNSKEEMTETSSNYETPYKTVTVSKQKNLLMENISNTNFNFFPKEGTYNSRAIWELNLRKKNYSNMYNFNSNLLVKELKDVHYLDSGQNYKKKLTKNINLDIQGEKLINVEENLIKSNRGNKRLFIYKYRPEEVKCMTIVQNYRLKKHIIE